MLLFVYLFVLCLVALLVLLLILSSPLHLRTKSLLFSLRSAGSVPALAALFVTIHYHHHHHQQQQQRRLTPLPPYSGSAIASRSRRQALACRVRSQQHSQPQPGISSTACKSRAVVAGVRHTVTRPPAVRLYLSPCLFVCLFVYLLVYFIALSFVCSFTMDFVAVCVVGSAAPRRDSNLSFDSVYSTGGSPALIAHCLRYKFCCCDFCFKLLPLLQMLVG